MATGDAAFAQNPCSKGRNWPRHSIWVNIHKDNIHWFKAVSDTAFIFNVHVIGYDPKIKDAGGRLYLDPEGEKLAGGLVKAPKMSSADCHRKYG